MKKLSLVLRFVVVLCFVLMSNESTTGQDEQGESSSDEAAIREKLVELRERLITAYEARDLDKVVAELGPDTIVTWQNADRNRGPEEFRAFCKKMTEGDSAIVSDVSGKVELDGSIVLYGDSSAVACGSTEDKFTLHDGKDFTLNSKWTASLAKVDGQWKVVAYHVSADIFDNPFLAVAKSWLITAAIVGSLLGFVLGAFIMWFITNSTKRLAAE